MSTRGQARSEGWTDRQVRRRVEVGVWNRVAGIGLASSDTVIGAWQLGSAACLTWPGAVISHGLAGALWGLPNCRRDVATVTVEPWQVLRGHRLRARRSELPRNEITRLSGLVVTTRDRTAVDLLALLAWSDARNLWAWLWPVVRSLIWIGFELPLPDAPTWQGPHSCAGSSTPPPAGL